MQGPAMQITTIGLDLGDPQFENRWPGGGDLDPLVA